MDTRKSLIVVKKFHDVTFTCTNARNKQLLTYELADNNSKLSK